MSHLIKLIKLIEAQTFYVYLAIVDDVTCQKCLGHEQKTFTQDEIENEFEYAEQINDNLWLPNVHPNCRCNLIGYEIPDEEGPIKVPGKLTDEQFDDWLTGLLSAGYITAAIYDKTVARRKKQKEANK